MTTATNEYTCQRSVGDNVYVGTDGHRVECVITAVLFRGPADYSYEVCWFDGGCNRHIELVQPCEVWDTP